MKTLSDLNIVCLIPARGGSKGIPRKNLVEVGGSPMLAWSIDRGLRSKYIRGQVYVTSDSPEILAVTKRYGGREVLRPPEFSTDTATSESALLHALDQAEDEIGRAADYVVFLQPTSPVRRPNELDLAIEKLAQEGADSLLSVRPMKDYFIWGQTQLGGTLSHIGLNFDYRNRKRRQEIETTYLENGSLYVFKPELLRNEGNRLGGRIALHEMDFAHSFQIDNQEDIDLCDYFLKRFYHGQVKAAE